MSSRRQSTCRSWRQGSMWQLSAWRSQGGTGVSYTLKWHAAATLPRLSPPSLTHTSLLGPATHSFPPTLAKWWKLWCNSLLVPHLCFSGSDAASIQTRATLAEDGKHFLINGSKVMAVCLLIPDGVAHVTNVNRRGRSYEYVMNMKCASIFLCFCI